MKRYSACEDCKGTMYSDFGLTDKLLAKPVWICANCGKEEPRLFRRTSKKNRLDKTFNELLNFNT